MPGSRTPHLRWRRARKVAGDAVILVGIGCLTGSRGNAVLRCVVNDDNGLTVGIVTAVLMQQPLRRQQRQQRHERARDDTTPVTRDQRKHGVQQYRLA